jgi:hypothetical protein
MRGTTWITGLIFSLSLVSSVSAHPGHPAHDLPPAMIGATLVAMTGIGAAMALKPTKRPALSVITAGAGALLAVGIWLIGM